MTEQHTDLLTPHCQPEMAAPAGSNDICAAAAPKDPTAAGRQRGYRERRRAEECNSTGDDFVVDSGGLFADQAGVGFEIMRDLDLVLTQESFDGSYHISDRIIIANDYTENFLNALQENRLDQADEVRAVLDPFEDVLGDIIAVPHEGKVR
jgi:hypothetical protein